VMSALLCKKKEDLFSETLNREEWFEESPNRIIASADFSDGHREVLLDLQKLILPFWMVN
jgi:hypothetical protein